MLFGPKPPVDEDEWDWLLAGLKWLDREFPELANTRALALPTPVYFPSLTHTADEERGRELMEQVQAIAGLSGWPLVLEIVEAPSNGPVNAVVAVQHGKGAAGTFQLRRDADGKWTATIRYGRDALQQPMKLTATFAHELAHYLLATRRKPIPGGDEVEELFTDLTAVWLGFGIFLGNSARHSARSNAGWFVSGWQGYLSDEC